MYTKFKLSEFLNFLFVVLEFKFEKCAAIIVNFFNNGSVVFGYALTHIEGVVSWK